MGGKVVVMESTAHSPIIIDGNTEMDNFFSGNSSMGGNETNPYILDNFTIDAGGSGSGIYIKNTDRNLIISNCSINNSGSGLTDSGIKLEFCYNITIDTCVSDSNRVGLYAYQSEDLVIQDSNFTQNLDYGAYIDTSSSLSFFNCKFDNNSDTGMQLYRSENTNVTSCNFSDNSDYGLKVNENSRENNIFYNNFQSNPSANAVDDGEDNSWDDGVIGNHWDDYLTQNPNATNDGIIWSLPYNISGVSTSKDNYPMFTLGSHVPIFIDGNAELSAFPDKSGSGTLIDPYVIRDLVISARGGKHCMKISNTNLPLTLINCTISAALEGTDAQGILITSSTNITITNCTVKYNDDGVKFVSSHNNTIMKSNITNNEDNGVEFSSSTNLVVKECLLQNNSLNAIYFGAISSNNSAINNTCLGNRVNGIIISQGASNLVSNNVISGSYYGITISWSNNNTIFNNNVSDCFYYGLKISTGDFTNASSNTLENNTAGGIFIQNTKNATFSDNQMFLCSVILEGSVESISTDLLDNSNKINGKSLYFFVNGTSLTSSNYSDPGQLILVNCNDSLIQNVNISNTTAAILILYGENNTFSNNSIYSSKQGISIIDSLNFTIKNNSFYSCEKGINIARSVNGSIYDNNITRGGIWLEGSLEESSSHSIDVTNLVNQKPIYYYANQTGLVSSNFSNAGQVILVNCPNSSISNSIFHDLAAGVISYYSDDCVYENITIINSGIGIRLEQSHNNSIIGSSFQDNDYGIYARTSTFFNLTNSTFMDCNICGLYFLFGDNSALHNNTVTGDSQIGFYFSNLNNLTLTNNSISVSGYGAELDIVHEAVVEINVFDSCEIGLILYGVKETSVVRNNFTANRNIGLYLEYDIDNNLIMQNNFINNTLFHAYFYDYSSSGTMWNNATIGNYWSDYQTKYPLATNDGETWNLPYEINGSESSQDFHPLLYQYEPSRSPLANFTTNATSVIKNSPVLFTFSGRIGNTPATFQWNFGDSSGNDTRRNPDHEFTETGNFTVTVTITDRDGQASTYSESDCIHVYNNVPISNFTTNDTTPTPYAYVQFNFTGSEGDGPATFEWDFGDGSPHSSVKNPVHQFNSTGDFNVTLTVIDYNGDMHSLTKESYIQVSDTIPVVQFYSGNPTSPYASVLVNTVVNFIFTGSQGDEPASFNWNFGDLLPNATTINPSHLYFSAGNYSVILTVVDSNGDSDTLQKIDYMRVFLPNVDSDGDGLLNAEEINTIGTDPGLYDSDGDGMADGWEVVHGLNPLNNTDRFLDPDRDTLNNLEEFQVNSDPNDPDSDNDGLNDGNEVFNYGTSPILSDTDGDGFSDKVEVIWNSDPTDPSKTPVITWTLIIITCASAFVLSFVFFIHVKKKKSGVSKNGSDKKNQRFIKEIDSEEALLDRKIEDAADSFARRAAEKRIMISRTLEPQAPDLQPKKGAFVTRPVKAKKLKTSTDGNQPITREIDEKTEKELEIEKPKEYCIVCNGILKGTNYICPICETKYCIRCAIMLSERGEECWTCKEVL
ncbi:MAG: NosD domain-containing protein, partial [Promethearchaeota archaeon]